MTSADFEFRFALESFKRGDHADAEQRLKAAAKAQPRHPGVLNLLGALLASQERYQEAEPVLRAATKIQPVSAATLYNYGLALQNLNRRQDALAAFDKALTKDPRSADAWFGRGSVLLESGKLQEAIACFDRTLAIDPNFALAFSNKGAALLALRRYSEAMLNLNECLRIEPSLATAHLNKARALHSLRQFGLAFASVETATTLAPNVALGWAVRSNICQELRRTDEAVECLRKALSLDPSNRDWRDSLIERKLWICDWSNYQNDFDALREEIRSSRAVSPSLCVSLPFSAAEQFAAAQARVKASPSRLRSVSRDRPTSRQGRIRVAYLSAELRAHPTATLFVGALQRHDRSRFEIVVLNDAARDDSPLQKRIIDAVESFVDVYEFDDDRLIDFIRKQEIDILVNLDFANDSIRTEVFDARAAPLQVNYLGFPGTAAAPNCDYFIADPIVIPRDSRQWFAEKIVYLPDCYQPNDSKREIATQPVSRREAGLPDDAFVFCCFNNNLKLNPDTLDEWARILSATPGSVLWLLKDSAATIGNLKREAEARGVDPSRLVLAKRITGPEHLARHRLADLFLDSWPYGAHTTASDALWAGLPVLTYAGETFASRVAASLLTAVGLPELIAASREAYVATAINLAADPDRLTALKERLERNRATAPLFATELYMRRFEAAFEAMHARCGAGLPPDDIHVPA
jgi:predicted O-linked N-acetylglucosamine transferase (SPINDLY family)